VSQLGAVARVGEIQPGTGRVTCPWHGVQFDLATGNAVAPQARQSVTPYRVAVQGEPVTPEP